MLPNIKASKLLLRELDNLVKAIGECKSKAEEDRIIAQEVDTLKQRLNDPKLDKSRGRCGCLLWGNTRCSRTERIHVT